MNLIIQIGSSQIPIPIKEGCEQEWEQMLKDATAKGTGWLSFASSFPELPTHVRIEFISAWFWTDGPGIREKFEKLIDKETKDIGDGESWREGG